MHAYKPPPLPPPLNCPVGAMLQFKGIGGRDCARKVQGKCNKLPRPKDKY